MYNTILLMLDKHRSFLFKTCLWLGVISFTIQYNHTDALAVYILCYYFTFVWTKCIQSPNFHVVDQSLRYRENLRGEYFIHAQPHIKCYIHGMA